MYVFYFYIFSDSQMCLRYIAYWGGKTNIVFIGDSRIRQLFYGFVSLINPKYTVDKELIHHNLNYSDEELKVNIVSKRTKLYVLYYIFFILVFCTNLYTNYVIFMIWLF